MARLFTLTMTLLCAMTVHADDNAAALNAIRDRAMTSDWTYQRLSDLTYKIGPRLSGSPQAQAAVEQVAAAMKADGFKVTLQPMRAPHWVRGVESAELVAYLGRPNGSAQSLLPHTGQMAYASDAGKIPTAALSAEDAMLVHRLANQGAVTLKLVLTPQRLPDVDSYNVVADLVSSEKPDEIALVSGHLDSWDLATGAIDDGAGIAAAMGAAHVIKELNLIPKRTMRVVAWMSEDNSGAGAQAYFDANKANTNKHVAVIESDTGAGKPLGLAMHVAPESLTKLQPVFDALVPIGASAVARRQETVGSDPDQMQNAGVPGFEPLLDARHYFDYHHTAADTLDKVDPKNLQRMVATMAVLAYHIANAPEMLERAPVVKE